MASEISADALAEQNAFRLWDKSALHYLLLALIVVVPVLILWALVLCVRAQIHRKWVWILFILFGVAAVRFDWTSGQMSFQPVSVQLLGAGMMKMGIHAPWILTVSFPLGAVVFLLRRRSLEAAAGPVVAPPEVAAAPTPLADLPMPPPSQPASARTRTEAENRGSQAN